MFGFGLSLITPFTCIRAVPSAVGPNVHTRGKFNKLYIFVPACFLVQNCTHFANRNLFSRCSKRTWVCLERTRQRTGEIVPVLVADDLVETCIAANVEVKFS